MVLKRVGKKVKLLVMSWVVKKALQRVEKMVE